MSAELRRLFPEGLKNNEAERGKPRHEPPLRFAPSKSVQPDDGEDTNSKTITVELGQKTTMKVVPYVFVDVESFLAYQKQHTYILDQQDSKANWAKLASALEDTNLKICDISPNSIVPQDKTTRKRLVETKDSLRKKMEAIITKAFTLYQNMSAPALRNEWDDIVAEHCFTTGWLDEHGAPSNDQRGQDWEALAIHKRLHLLTVCDMDAAERHDQYMNVTLKKPQRLAIKPFYKRVKELDELAPSLPCLKDQLDCPAEVERRNVSMSPFAMCGLLMRNVSVQIEDEYNCLHSVVPTNPKKLVEQLTKIETKLGGVPTHVPKTVRLKGDGQPDDPNHRSRSEKKRAKAERGGGGKPTDSRIPRKELAPPRADKSCKLCAEYGGSSKTHTTHVCKKWLPGGKPHPEWRSGKQAANINVHQGSDVNQLMAQQAEFNKTIMKQMAKLGKKKKKKHSRQRFSDSDSSNSE